MNEVVRPRWQDVLSKRKARSKPNAASHGARVDPELEALADWLDTVFRIPGLGIRFGLDAVLGLIPGIGDTFTSLASLYILHAATRYGVPRVTILRMAMNVAIDYVLGTVPVVGDVFDVFWKSNQRNVALLRRHMASAPRRRKRASWSDRIFVGVVVVALFALLLACIAVAWSAIGWLASFLR